MVSLSCLDESRVDGIAALHLPGPDVALMEKEEGELDDGKLIREARMKLRQECLRSFLAALVEPPCDRRRVFARVAMLVWTYCPQLALNADSSSEFIAAAPDGADVLGRVVGNPDVLEIFLRRVMSAGVTDYLIPREVYYLAYEVLRPTRSGGDSLVSMEEIGRHLGLRATNKRSAVSAGIKSRVHGAIQRAERRETPHAHHEGWYSKRAETRDKYRRAQMGNGNKRGWVQRRARSTSRKQS
ncbi:MAG: hypothetical protein ACYS26_13455 [Planctomycetota bacterium]